MNGGISISNGFVHQGVARRAGGAQAVDGGGVHDDGAWAGAAPGAVRHEEAGRGRDRLAVRIVGAEHELVQTVAGQAYLHRSGAAVPDELPVVASGQSFGVVRVGEERVVPDGRGHHRGDPRRRAVTGLCSGGGEPRLGGPVPAAGGAGPGLRRDGPRTARGPGGGGGRRGRECEQEDGGAGYGKPGSASNRTHDPMMRRRVAGYAEARRDGRQAVVTSLRVRNAVVAP